jgi:hypothetical protein
MPATRTCETWACGASLEGRRRHARFCKPCAKSRGNADRCREYRKRKKARDQRQRLGELVSAYLEQTRKRSVHRVRLKCGELADALATLSDSDLGEVLSVIARSPETAAREDAWHRRMPLRDDLNQPTWEPPYDGAPGVSWCMANRCGGVWWPGRPYWIAERGSLGYSPRNRAYWRSHSTVPLSAVQDGTNEQYREAAAVSAAHAAQLRA